jgi:hypothetical protein
MENDPSTLDYTLPGGYRDASGRLHRDVSIRALTGREEEVVSWGMGRLSFPALVTCVLAGCVRRLGPMQPVTEALAGSLLVPDREFALLKVRELTLGDRISAILVCPACAQKMDVDFSAAEVPIEARRPEATTDTIQVAAADGGWRRVEFRLPTGADQELLGGASTWDERLAVRALLEQCLVRADGARGEGTALDDEACAAVDEAMARVSPSIDFDLNVVCPECGHRFVQPVDFARLFFQEIVQRRGQLYHEVHVLARHYHWSEAEILGLTRAKRRMYLEFLATDRHDGGPAER